MNIHIVNPHDERRQKLATLFKRAGHGVNTSVYLPMASDATSPDLRILSSATENFGTPLLARLTAENIPVIVTTRKRIPEIHKFADTKKILFMRETADNDDPLIYAHTLGRRNHKIGSPTENDSGFKVGPYRYDAPGHKIEVGGVSLGLSRTETDYFVQMLRCHDTIISQEEIYLAQYSEVRSAQDILKAATANYPIVKVMINAIRTKLDKTCGEDEGFKRVGVFSGLGYALHHETVPNPDPKTRLNISTRRLGHCTAS